MPDVYAVISDSQQEAHTALTRLCETFGLEPMGPLMETAGRSKWMARATAPTARATTPADSEARASA